jgi:hypothetical protein
MVSADYADRSAMTQRTSQRFRGAIVTVAATLAASALGGCGVSSITSGLSSSVFGSGGSSSGETAVSEAQLLAEAKSGETGAISQVSAGCPRFVVWPRDNNVTIYEPGRVGDGLAIMHRAEITKTARECYVEQGRVTVRYGFSGRVLLGPKGVSGPVRFPVNVFVTDAKREKIKTEKLEVASSLAVENPIGYFSAVQSVTFDIPEGARAGEFEVYVGFERNTPNAG